MRRGEVDAVIVGCDRVAANGDVANKVGTYAHALAARAAGIPFVVAGPTSTIDPALPDGDGIAIEERDGDEVRRAGGALLTVADTPCRNPAFDVTPAELVSALVTERGVAAPSGPRLRRRAARPVRVAWSVTPREVVLEERPDPVAGPGEVVCRVAGLRRLRLDVSEG